jgi:hypothetical protein
MVITRIILTQQQPHPQAFYRGAQIVLEGRGGRAQRLLPGAAGFTGYYPTNYLIDGCRWVGGGDLSQLQHERSPAHDFEVVEWEARASRAEGPARACASMPQETAQHRGRIEVRAAGRASASGRPWEHVITAT